MTVRSNTRVYIASTSVVLLVLAISLAYPYPAQAREISVPLEAVKASKTERLSAWQLSREKVRVPINWVRQEWIDENFNGKIKVKVYDENYEPLNTSVLLEGEYEGTTGSDGEKLIDNLGPDNYYSIKVKKGGYKNESESVILDSGETQNVTFRLEKKIGKASIEVAVIDDTDEDLHAEVYLDGVYADDTSYYTGKTTIESVEPGHHDVTVKKSGYETETKYIQPSSGENVELTITLVEENITPRAEFSYSPSEPEVGQTIEFESESVDPDGEIEGYSWDYGDYSSDYSQNPTHSYSSPGSYEVTLTVEDDRGSKDEVSKTITVKEKKARLKINTLNEAGEVLTVPIYLDGSREGLSWGGYYVFQGLTPVYHEVKIESDNYKNVVKNVKFPETGEKVVDIILEKPNKKPNAGFDFSPADPKVGQAVKFEVESEDPDGEIVDYNWSFGDGSATSIKEPTHKYSRKGNFSVELTVTDDGGRSSSTIEKIKISEKKTEESEVEIEEKHALVIGISDYKHDTIKDLDYPEQDARNFYEFLLNDKFENFSKEHVTLLTNGEATAGEIRKEMSQLVMEVEKDDLVIIYFSGHGALGPDKNGDEKEDDFDEYFVAYDTNNSSGAELYSSGIRDDQFGNWLASMDSKQVAMFLDSCYSGGATKSAKSTSIPGQKAVPENTLFNDFSSDNRLLFAASKEGQPSWESPELNQGVFTHFLLKGLRGGADKNDDGKIVATELYRYLRPHVSSYVEEHFTSNQVPLMKGGITAPLAAEKGRLKGKVASIVGEDKKEAGSGDYVMLSIGKKDKVKKGDQFRVFLNTKAVGVIRKVHGVIEVIEVVGPHLSFAKISKSKFMVKKGYKIVKMEEK